MRSSPLVRTLQLLTQEEFETLHYFVASPIFNERNRFQDTLALFEYLKLHYPKFDSEELDREKVGAELFPERKEKDNEVNKAMAQMMHILRQFIIYRHFAVRDGQTVRKSAKKEFAENPVLLLNFARQQVALMHFYRSRLGKLTEEEDTQANKESGKRPRKADHFFDILYKDLQEGLTAQTAFQRFDDPEFDEYHLFRYLGEYEKYQYESLLEKRGEDQNLLASMVELDRFYLHSKIDLMIRLAHFMNMAAPFPSDSEELRQWETNVITMKSFIQSIQEQQYLQEPGIRLQCHMLRFLLEKDPVKADAAAIEARQLIQQYGYALPAKRVADFRVILRSHWGRRYSVTRDSGKLEESFQLILEQLEQDGAAAPIQASHYVNCILIGLKLDKIEWAKDFSSQYGNRIVGTKYPELVKNIIDALVAFERQELALSAATLPHYFNYSALDDIFQYALAATLDVRIRYEQHTLDDDYGVNMLKATRTFIEREETLPSHRKAERILFFKLTDRLYKLRRKYQLKKTDLSKDLQEIKNILQTHAVVDGKWLTEKVEELESKIGSK